MRSNVATGKSILLLWNAEGGIKVKNVVKRIPGVTRVIKAVAPSHIGGRQALLAMLPKTSIGAEIGVHLGDFSQRILDVVRPKLLHLVDPWEHRGEALYAEAWYGGQARSGQSEMDERYASVCDRFKQHIRDGRVRIHRAYSSEALARFDDGCLDWIYIDGNHLYQYVREDLRLSVRKTKPGGLISGDDYIDGGWWEGGVKRAVDELVGSRTSTLIELGDGQFVLTNTAKQL